MSGRYDTLYNLRNNLWVKDSPVIIEAGALLKDNKINRVVAQLKIKNISETTLKAVIIDLIYYDVSGEKIGDCEYQYLDLSVKRDEVFGQKNAIDINCLIARSFDVIVKKVIFFDESSWDNKLVYTSSIQKPRRLSEVLPSTLAEQFHRNYNESFDTYPDEFDDFWYCACGALNYKSEEQCHICKNTLKRLKIDLDQDKLASQLQSYQEEQDYIRKEEQLKLQQKEEKKKKRIKKLAIIVGCFLLVFCIYKFTTNVLIPGRNYRKAEEAFAKKEYVTAAEYYNKSIGYKDSSKKSEMAIFLNDMERTRTKVIIDLSYKKVDDTTRSNIDKLIKGNGKYGFEINADYLNAYYYYYNADYITALQYYEKLNSDDREDISDCPDKAAVQQTEINNQKVYDQAIEYCENHEYKKAYEKFKTIEGFSNVDELMKRIETLDKNKFKGIWKWSPGPGEKYEFITHKYLYIEPFYYDIQNSDEIWYHVQNNEHKHYHFMREAGWYIPEEDDLRDFYKPKKSDANTITSEDQVYRSISYKDNGTLMLYDHYRGGNAYGIYKKIK